jgi:tyrosyl-tRNA synthetase
MADNADWLLGLKYIEFLRDIGKHFSVNRMLAAETYKMRMETHLSFLEFNYQILQAYDYLSCSGSTAAPCKWAGTTSGGTSSRGWTSSGAWRRRRSSG